MSSSILHDALSDKLCSHLPFPVLEEVYPAELVREVLTSTRRWERRERKLNHLVMVYLLIAWTMLPLSSLSHVLSRLTSTMRWLSDRFVDQRVPTSGALSYRRKQVGVLALRTLFRRAVHPLADAHTPGAFAFGLRLLAVDGTLFTVADTPQNARTFGRPQQSHVAIPVPTHESTCLSPFPQVRCVSLIEVGTHVVLDAIVAPSPVSEICLAHPLLRRLPPDSLLLMDSGFRSACLLETAHLHGTHVLTRLQVHDHETVSSRLCDGSYLVQVPRTSTRPLQQPFLTLRIIEYRLAESIAAPLAQMRRSRSHTGSPRQPSLDQVYRLATTLLDPLTAPAAELAACYHERWEIEQVIDEHKEHQLVEPRLASKTPRGVLQEVYALFLGHYALRFWMHASARMAPVLDADRLSFVHAIEVLGTALTLATMLSESAVECWRRRVCEDLREPSHLLLEQRRVRSYPRVVKACTTRFSRKHAQDVGFRVADHRMCWQDFILLI